MHVLHFFVHYSTGTLYHISLFEKKKTDDKENNFHLVLLCLFSVSTKYIFACIFSHTHDFLNAKTAIISLIWYFLRL